MDEEPPPPRVEPLGQPIELFEFGEGSERIFSDLALAMRITAWFQLLLGGVALLAAAVGLVYGGQLFRGIKPLVSGGMLVTMAVFLFQAAGRFRLVVETTGKDIKHLMEAVRRLRTVFLVQAVGFSLELILAVIVRGGR